MFVGVFFYSFTISSLTSFLAGLDSRHMRLQQKMNCLVAIKNEFDIGNQLFSKIRKALTYGIKLD